MLWIRTCNGKFVLSTVLRIRITLMWIRMRIRIRILLITLMRIRILIFSWCGSGYGSSPWCGCGSGSWSRFPKWCRSMRIRIYNTGWAPFLPAANLFHRITFSFYSSHFLKFFAGWKRIRRALTCAQWSPASSPSRWSWRSTSAQVHQHQFQHCFPVQYTGQLNSCTLDILRLSVKNCFEKKSDPD